MAGYRRSAVRKQRNAASPSLSLFSSPWTPGASHIQGGSLTLRKFSGDTLPDVFPR